MHDLIASLEQASRAVADTELRDAPAHLVELRRAFHAPIGDVWDACTNPERVSARSPLVPPAERRPASRRELST
jgi:hypothetical protein